MTSSEKPGAGPGIWIGECLACGRETELFPGKSYCDECLEDIERKARERDIEMRRRDALAKARALGLLAPMTGVVCFANSLDFPPEHDDVVEQAQRWALKRDVNVYIYGSVGVGKSHLARCVMYDATQEGCTIGECSGNAIASCSLYDTARIHAMAWPDVLLIDDIDKAAWNPSSLMILRDVLDIREQAGKRLIMTANADKAELIRILTRRAGDNASLVPAILDRLNTHQGRTLTLHMTGKSRRGTFTKEEE